MSRTNSRTRALRSRHKRNVLVLVIILVLIMVYPPVLQTIGLPPTVILSATASASLLAVRLSKLFVVRRSATPAAPRHQPLAGS